MLDIGHRGAGASATARARVAENTLLAFQAAAAVHTDYVELDVHCTADGEVVVHHDAAVRVAVGKSATVTLSIQALTLAQLRSAEFAAAMRSGAQPGDRAAALGAHAAVAARSLKRTLSSGEDVMRTHARPQFGSPPVDGGDELADVAEAGAGDGAAAAAGTASRSRPPPPRAPSSGAAVAATAPAPTPWRIADRVATLRECFRTAPPWLGWNCELKYADDDDPETPLAARPLGRNQFADAVLRVVMDEAGGHGPGGGSPTVGGRGGGRRVIFSSFDPDMCTLLALKQPRHSVFFLTNSGTETFKDPRMNGVEAALDFAAASNLQGVVAHAAGVLHRLDAVVAAAHARGLHLFTWGDDNNDPAAYAAQRAAGVDGVISDDVAAHTRAAGKRASHFVAVAAEGGSVADAAGGSPPRGEGVVAGLRALGLSSE
jgi:glycerophosphodiester phosphodiesterase